MPSFPFSMCGGRLPFSDLRLCVEQKFFCADWCVIHIVYAHFPIHNLSNSLCLFGALCAHRTIPGVFAQMPTAPHWSLVCSTLNARIHHSLCIANCHNLYCFFVFQKRTRKLAHHHIGLLCAHSSMLLWHKKSLPQAHCTSQSLTGSDFCLQDGTGQVLQNSDAGAGWDGL